jgi:VIT1/CCC1 family predicted Fe2+/Mn2+ transporter
MSLAAGEYVPVRSQSDTEAASFNKERARNPARVERAELKAIYIERGFDEDLARRAATQLMEKDALAAHARDELGVSEITTARPIQAALTSALTFAVGATLPLLVVLVAPTAWLIWAVAIASLIFPGVRGAVGARGVAHLCGARPSACCSGVPLPC